MEKLKVKNFGAIKDIDIELKDLTIFIGKSGAGKSTLAKLIAIFRSSAFWKEEKTFEELLHFYEIASYLKEDTSIAYIYADNVFANYENSVINFGIDEALVQKSKHLQTKYAKNLNIEDVLFQFIYESLTIPAERQLASRLSEKYIVLQNNEDIAQVFPKVLIDFIAKWNTVSSHFSGEIYQVPIFDVAYEKGKDGKDYLVLPNEAKLLMTVSASGMQTAIPALLVMDYYSQDKDQKRSFVFEEPELNLFPYAQGHLMEFMAEKVLNSGHQLVICTHSDHILYSTLVLCKKLEEEGNGIDRNRTQIYFLRDESQMEEYNIVGDEKQAVSIPIHEGGRIFYPPKGFFDKIKLDRQYLMGF